MATTTPSTALAERNTDLLFVAVFSVLAALENTATLPEEVGGLRWQWKITL